MITNIQITVEPVYWGQRYPNMVIGYNSYKEEQILDKISVFSFDIINDNNINLFVEMYDKTNNDCIRNRDLAICIKELKIMNIKDDRFILNGLYTPKYPEPWYSQQCENNKIPCKILKNVDRLSWNGRWELTITSPTFTWIHNVLNNGWIYPTSHFQID